MRRFSPFPMLTKARRFTITKSPVIFTGFWEIRRKLLLKIMNIEAVAKIAKSENIITAIDNTFAMPFNQRPVELGIDLIVHSATKYLGGHSDLTAGIIVGKQEFTDRARNTIGKLYGGNIAPQIAWLILRGIKTLALRMERHNKNAYVIAHMLVNYPKVNAVFYPSLANHKNHGTARDQMSGFGGIISFDAGNIEAGKLLLITLKSVFWQLHSAV